MQWRDEAIVLGGRKFGEGGLVLDVLTAGHGRRSGLVHGGASRKRRAQFEPGNSVSLAWSARLEDQLGRFDTAELKSARAAALYDAPEALSAVQTITAVLRDALSDGDRAGSSVYHASLLLLDSLSYPTLWPALYVRWELGLLSELGFGLDFSACAVSGANDGLTHVSPRTGRAVRGSDVPDYAERLLKLPGFLLDSSHGVPPDDLAAGFRLTGHFLRYRLYEATGRQMPTTRDQMLARLKRTGAIV
ncbi:MAG: DNA repair protein RecO [Pseudomonadota bacterium]